MGDLIYTTPVIRCIKNQVPDVEIHFLTKEKFADIFDGNPYLDRLLFLDKSLQKTITSLKKEQYDYVIDLHNNIRSSLIKIQLGVKSSTYQKYTIRKWLSLRFKMSLVPNIHLVNRYLKTVKFLNVHDDGKPIDYFIKKDYNLKDLLPESHQQKYVAFIIGAAHVTKRMPNYKIIETCNKIDLPIVLLGGKDVADNGEIIKKALKSKVYNTCGNLMLDESVFLVSRASAIAGFDTGLTHIAEAFDKPIVSIWGSTVPELVGVKPYHVKNVLLAAIDLPCRPCSKYGLEKCPLGHFNCMNKLKEEKISGFINRFSE